MKKKSEQSSEPAFPKGVAKPALRALAAVGITRLDQAAQFTERELSELHGMGPKAMGIIREALKEKGKGFAEER